MEEAQLEKRERWENRVLLPAGFGAERAAVEKWLEGEGRSETVVFATSGSAGRPKFVVHTRATLEASARAVNSHLEATASDRWLRAIPPNHVGGVGVHVRAWLSGTGLDVLPGRWDPGVFLDALSANRTTLTSLVPTQVFDLVETGSVPPGELRAAIVGGGRFDAELAARARALGWPVLASYGATEAGSQIATERIGFPGEMTVLEGWEVRADAVRGAALAEGILVEHAGTLALRPIRDAEGWFATGDALTFGSAGGVTRVKRLGRTVKVLGELVDLDAVEGVFRAAAPPGVEVAVLALPDPRRENALALATTGGCDWSADVEISGIRRPQSVHLVGEIPRSPLGKILYGELTAGFLTKTSCKPEENH